MKKMKKTLCILLSLLMVLAMIPGTALAGGEGPAAEPVMSDVLGLMYGRGPEAADAPFFAEPGAEGMGIMLLEGVKDSFGRTEDFNACTYIQKDGCKLLEFDSYTITVSRDNTTICTLTNQSSGPAYNETYHIGISANEMMKKADGNDPVYFFVLNVDKFKETQNKPSNYYGLYKITVSCSSGEKPVFGSQMYFYIPNGDKWETLTSGDNWYIARDWNNRITNLGFDTGWTGTQVAMLKSTLEAYKNGIDNIIIEGAANNIPCDYLGKTLGNLRSIDTMENNAEFRSQNYCFDQETEALYARTDTAKQNPLITIRTQGQDDDDPEGPVYEEPTTPAPAEGLAIWWNGQWAQSGDTLLLRPNQLLQGLLYLNGEPYTGQYPMADSFNDDIIEPGISPDGKVLEGWLKDGVNEGDKCIIAIYYGENNTKSALFTLKATTAEPEINLKWGNFIIEPEENFGFEENARVEVLYGGQKITDYKVGINGNSAVCEVQKNADGTFSIKTNGNGTCQIIIDYNKLQESFYWDVEGYAGAVSNFTITCDEKTKMAGEELTLIGKNETFTGTFKVNGQQVVPETINAQAPPGGTACTVTNYSDGTFTLTTPGKDSYTDLVIKYQIGEKIYSGKFGIRTQTPDKFVFQYNGMEPGEHAGQWEAQGYGTLSVFKKWRQDKYMKFVVTDQNMRRVDRDHFVAATPENLKVLVYDKRTGKYMPCSTSPFAISVADDANGVLKISYDRRKDIAGPAYMLRFTGNDKYLDNQMGIQSDKEIFIWTRSIGELVLWNKLVRNGENWFYDARSNQYSGMMRDDDCDIRHVGVEMPADLFGTGNEQISLQEGSTLEIETDLGTVTFDEAVLKRIEQVNQNVTLNILSVNAEDEEYAEVSGALSDAKAVVDLKLVYSENAAESTISQFGNGETEVSLKYTLEDSGKTPQVYYVNEKGEKTAVDCVYNEASGELTFGTNHFSIFSVEEIENKTTPSTPGGLPVTSTDKVTQSGDTTTADLSGSTTSKGGETTTTVDQTTADKMVETAVKNNSEEIVINAVTKNESAASSTKAAEVVLAGETLQTIAEKTDADVVVKTNVAEVKLDNKTAEAVASQTGEGETVSIITEKVKEEAKEVQFELKIITSSGKVISDFDGGNVAVTVNVPKSLSNKKVVCVYIDEKGHMHKVDGTLNADGTYTFTTGHFSTYALMYEGEAEAAIEAQKEAVKALKPTLRSSQVKTKSGKKAIKLTWKGGEDIQLDGIEIYRSLKKSSGYGKKPFYTTTKTSYLNTSVKAGKKYYYKVRGFVTIDGEKVYTQYSTKAWRTVK